MIKRLALVAFIFAVAATTLAFEYLEWGTTVDYVGVLSPRMAADLEKTTGKRLSLGFKYQSVSTAGLDLWTWDGAFCLFEKATVARPLTYRVISRELAASAAKDAGYALRVPLTYRFPGALLLATIVVVLGVPAALLIRRIRAREGPPISISIQ